MLNDVRRTAAGALYVALSLAMLGACSPKKEDTGSPGDTADTADSGDTAGSLYGKFAARGNRLLRQLQYRRACDHVAQCGLGQA